VKLHSIALALGAMIALALAAPAARADEDGPSYLTFGLGYFDVNKQDDDAADFRLEYRHGRGIWLIKPWAGVEATSDGAVYGLAGLLIDLVVGDHFVITPSVGVGAYSDGDGKDLGHTVEFRSQIEVGYRFDYGGRLTAAFGHISNAGLGDENPGVNIANVYYSVPLDALMGE
jgi:hypothetical protein